MDFLVIKFVAVFVLVLGLMLLCGQLLKRLGPGNFVGSKKKRLRLVETLALDAQRRLLIVRRDDKEHLIILGRNGETLVETGFAAEDAPAEEEPETVVKFARDQRNVKI